MKLPRRFGVFDYRIPEGALFSVGDVIEVPFRNRTILGVVAALAETTSESRVLDLTAQSPLFQLSEAHLETLRSIALELGQSTSSIISVAYEGLTKEADAVRRASGVTGISVSPTIDKETIEEVRAILDATKTQSRLAAAIDDESAAVLAHALCKGATQQVLILVPRERDAQFFGQLLRSFTPIVLTGRSKRRERNAIIRSWRSGSLRVLVGTRQAALIEPNDLGVVLVYQAACDDHGSTLRNPHVDAVRAVEKLSLHSEAKLLITDPLPPISNSLSSLRRLTTDDRRTLIVDASNRDERSAYPLLTQSLLEAIKLALHSGKKVLLSFNRKGVAKRLECKDCGHVPFCGTCGSLPTVRLDDLICEACGSEMWKPELCPSCGSKKIGPRSIGGTRIVEDLRKAFQESKVGKVEKGTVELDADIVVVTEYFWSSVIVPFRHYGFGLVAELLADVGFIPGDFRGAESTARKTQRLQNLAHREHAPCIIQTIARDRLQSLLGVDHVATQEAEIRKRYLLPPYGVVITFEGATINDLPEPMQRSVVNRNNILTAKIDHETYRAWRMLFPLIPDHVNLRIQQ